MRHLLNPLNMLNLHHSVVAVLLASTVASVSAQGQPDRVRGFAASASIRGQYIVVFKEHVADPRSEAANALRAAGGQGRVLHTYTAALKGFSAQLPDAAVQALRNNPNVDYIEEDQTVQLNASQLQAPWGLDRIDQIDRPLDSTYQYNASGKAVTSFIIDSGIRADHEDFGGRVGSGYSVIADGNNTNDCNGHGTHVAGTVGGATWGVAKEVAIVPVRVLDCSGSGAWSGVIAGIDWVAGDANASKRPAVANMSLGGGKSLSVNAAVARAVAKGVTMVVAAGNSNANACNYSPASEPTAITVAATTSSDSRASYSNYGTCVDLFAPGSSITSAWHTSATAIDTISGTSMASPHVAGAAALVLQSTPDASPAAVTQSIVGSAGTNKVSSAGTGSPNRLLYSLIESAATEPQTATVAVRDLAGTGVKASKNAWRARIVIQVRNVNTGAAVANAMASGGFSTGGSVSCITSDAGSCTVESPNLNNGTPATVFTIGTASGPNMVYDATQNTEVQERVIKP